jgi:hypothetical protein
VCAFSDESSDCSGLTYTPGMYASTSELAILCKALADDYPGTYYAPHHRSYGFRAIESYDEMIGLGKRTGCLFAEPRCRLRLGMASSQ